MTEKYGHRRTVGTAERQQYVHNHPGFLFLIFNFFNSIRDSGKKANKRNIKWKPKSYNDLHSCILQYRIGYIKSASLILALDTCRLPFLCLFSVKLSIKGCPTH